MVRYRRSEIMKKDEIPAHQDTDVSSKLPRESVSAISNKKSTNSASGYTCRRLQAFSEKRNAVCREQFSDTQQQHNDPLSQRSRNRNIFEKKLKGETLLGTSAVFPGSEGATLSSQRKQSLALRKQQITKECSPRTQYRGPEKETTKAKPLSCPDPKFPLGQTQDKDNTESTAENVSGAGNKPKSATAVAVGKIRYIKPNTSHAPSCRYLASKSSQYIRSSGSPARNISPTLYSDASSKEENAEEVKPRNSKQRCPFGRVQRSQKCTKMIGDDLDSGSLSRSTTMSSHEQKGERSHTSSVKRSHYEDLSPTNSRSCNGGAHFNTDQLLTQTRSIVSPASSKSDMCISSAQKMSSPSIGNNRRKVYKSPNDKKCKAHAGCLGKMSWGQKPQNSHKKESGNTDRDLNFTSKSVGNIKSDDACEVSRPDVGQTARNTKHCGLMAARSLRWHDRKVFSSVRGNDSKKAILVDRGDHDNIKYASTKTILHKSSASESRDTEVASEHAPSHLASGKTIDSNTLIGDGSGQYFDREKLLENGEHLPDIRMYASLNNFLVQECSDSNGDSTARKNVGEMEQLSSLEKIMSSIDATSDLNAKDNSKSVAELSSKLRQEDIVPVICFYWRKLGDSCVEEELQEQKGRQLFVSLDQGLNVFKQIMTETLQDNTFCADEYMLSQCSIAAECTGSQSSCESAISTGTYFQLTPRRKLKSHLVPRSADLSNTSPKSFNGKEEGGNFQKSDQQTKILDILNTKSTADAKYASEAGNKALNFNQGKQSGNDSSNSMSEKGNLSSLFSSVTKGIVAFFLNSSDKQKEAETDSVDDMARIIVGDNANNFHKKNNPVKDRSPHKERPTSPVRMSHIPKPTSKECHDGSVKKSSKFSPQSPSKEKRNVGSCPSSPEKRCLAKAEKGNIKTSKSVNVPLYHISKTYPTTLGKLRRKNSIENKKQEGQKRQKAAITEVTGEQVMAENQGVKETTLKTVIGIAASKTDPKNLDPKTRPENCSDSVEVVRCCNALTRDISLTSEDKCLKNDSSARDPYNGSMSQVQEKKDYLESQSKLASSVDQCPDPSLELLPSESTDSLGSGKLAGFGTVGLKQYPHLVWTWRCSSTQQDGEWPRTTSDGTESESVGLENPRQDSGDKPSKIMKNCIESVSGTESPCDSLANWKNDGADEISICVNSESTSDGTYKTTREFNSESTTDCTYKTTTEAGHVTDAIMRKVAEYCEQLYQTDTQAKTQSENDVSALKVKEEHEYSNSSLEQSPELLLDQAASISCIPTPSSVHEANDDSSGICIFFQGSPKRKVESIIPPSENAQLNKVTCSLDLTEISLKCDEGLSESVIGQTYNVPADVFRSLGIKEDENSHNIQDEKQLNLLPLTETQRNIPLKDDSRESSMNEDIPYDANITDNNDEYHFSDIHCNNSCETNGGQKHYQISNNEVCVQKENWTFPESSETLTVHNYHLRTVDVSAEISSRQFSPEDSEDIRPEPKDQTDTSRSFLACTSGKSTMMATEENIREHEISRNIDDNISKLYPVTEPNMEIAAELPQASPISKVANVSNMLTTALLAGCRGSFSVNPSCLFFSSQVKKCNDISECGSSVDELTADIINTSHMNVPGPNANFQNEITRMAQNYSSPVDTVLEPNIPDVLTRTSVLEDSTCTPAPENFNDAPYVCSPYSQSTFPMQQVNYTNTLSNNIHEVEHVSWSARNPVVSSSQQNDDSGMFSSMSSSSSAPPKGHNEISRQLTEEKVDSFIGVSIQHSVYPRNMSNAEQDVPEIGDL